MGLIDSWVAAKKPVEFHLDGQSGHDGSTYPKETTSTAWFDAFSATADGCACLPSRWTRARGAAVVLVPTR